MDRQIHGRTVESLAMGSEAEPTRGVIAWATYLPFRRLDRTEIAPVAGKGGGQGTRTVASFDEDPTTMAVQAARACLATTPAPPDSLLFATVVPAYADRTNASAIHAALRLPETVPALDLGLSARSAVGGLLLAAGGQGTTLVTSADIRTGPAGSAEESAGGDAAAAFVIGDDRPEAPVVAEIVATASVTSEFIDRWRAPGQSHSKVWDDKFTGTRLAPATERALASALDQANTQVADLAAVAVAAPTARLAKTIGANAGAVKVVEDFAASVGQCGAAQPALLLAHLLEQGAAGDRVALISATDGADVIILRLTDAATSHAGAPTLAGQSQRGAPLDYGRFLAWRGMLAVEPPRRPEPQRVSATAAARSTDWKFALVAGVDETTGTVHMPPTRVSADGQRTDEMGQRPMAAATGTIATFTVDRVAYSPSPPIVFAVVDFDGGGRMPVELCDCDPDEIATGARVEMTFRRLHRVDGIANYFWKARLVRG